MFAMQYAEQKDMEVWRELDRHISDNELRLKIAGRRAYLLRRNGVPIGVLRYNLFWDSIPFLTLLYLEPDSRAKGYGKAAMAQWEAEMRSMGYPCVMTSTQSDETAQRFYRKLGYKDAGCLLLTVPPLAQPAELFLVKPL